MRANEALSNANKGSTERVEYNPFAEDERRPVPSPSTLLSKVSDKLNAQKDLRVQLTRFADEPAKWRNQRDVHSSCWSIKT